MARNFPERLNSAGNKTLTKGNTLLSEDEINMIVVLRIRSFMKYMRMHHPEGSEQHFKMTVPRPGDNDEEAEEETGEKEEEEEEAEEVKVAENSLRKRQESANKAIVTERQSWPALGVVFPID